MIAHPVKEAGAILLVGGRKTIDEMTDMLGRKGGHSMVRV